jgi:anti-anti-sigma regulatory factor
MCLNYHSHLDDRSDSGGCTFVIHGGGPDTPTRLEIVGRLDTRNTVGLFALARGLEGDVDIDLSRSDFVDAAGVGGLISVARGVRARGGECTVAGGGELVERLLRLTGVEPLVDDSGPVAC